MSFKRKEKKIMNLEEIKIQKKNGTYEKYEPEKLLKAVEQSAIRARVGKGLTDDEQNAFIVLVEKDLKGQESNIITTSYLHMLCEKYLAMVAPDVGIAYTNYHSFRMSQAKRWEKIMGKCSDLLSDSTDARVMAEKNQNANADSTLASTTANFFGHYTAEDYWYETFPTSAEKQAMEDGYIYAHDKNGRSVYPLNCCLFRIDYVLEHGSIVNGVHYNKPKSLDVAFDVIGDLILIGASQQYGGFTIPRLDSILVPYAEMSYQIYLEKYKKLGVSEEIAEKQAEEDVKTDMYKGFQGLEIKLNTVASSRGDYPFTTVSIGLDTTKWGKMAAIACLDTRRGGQGEKGHKKPVLFPKIVFLFDKNLHSESCINNDVFEAGLACSAKCMYPDWLSLTGEGYVASMYKRYGIDGVISPMGCRAFLSPYYERGGFEPADENDKPIFEGRFNIGVFSLNLPMIYAQAKKEGKDFYENLNYYLEMIRSMHKRTYEALSHMKASKNPLGFCYGGFYGGNLKSYENIAPLLKYSTASFGITALNELEQLHHEKSLVEDGSFAVEVMEYINNKINEYKKADHILYAIYGTPAEKLCSTQVTQFKAKYGIIKNVSDREYVSNSFHCHVTEKITPIQKQNLEKRFWDYFNGGKIQYCKYPLGYNIAAMKTLILRAMEMGFYEGVNMSLSYCDDCGYEELEIGFKCPKCGSVHITQIDRMNGYLSFTRVGTDAEILKDKNGNEIVKIHTRFSPGKNAEIADRVSM